MSEVGSEGTHRAPPDVEDRSGANAPGTAAWGVVGPTAVSARFPSGRLNLNPGGRSVVSSSMIATADAMDDRSPPPAAPPDAALPDPFEARLVARARAGDGASFEQLYRRHVGRVYALCWRFAGGDEALAAELTQDAFVRAWQKLALFRGDSAFGTWLYRLVVNHVLSERRRLVRRRAVERPLEANGFVREASVRPRDGLDRDLEAAIARLPERARTVLILHDIEGYQHKEIAALAGMAVGTSKAQLHRARQLLKEWLT